MESVMGSKPEGLGELLSHGLHSRRQQRCDDNLGFVHQHLRLCSTIISTITGFSDAFLNQSSCSRAYISIPIRKSQGQAACH